MVTLVVVCLNQMSGKVASCESDVKLIDASGKECQNQCLQCAQAGEDFVVTRYVESDRIFLRNVGFFYHYAMGETHSGFFFRLICQV